MIEIVTLLAERGLTLQDKFAFGALKGLMIIFGEEYVPQAQFIEILGDEVSHLIKRKLPAWPQVARAALAR